MSNDQGEFEISPTESETTRTVGNPGAPGLGDPGNIPVFGRGSSEKVRCRNADKHVSGKSDSLVRGLDHLDRHLSQTPRERN